MNNREIQAAWKYHDGTKHSYWSIRSHPHFLDWANRPLPFKIYPKIEPLPLPRDLPQTGVAALFAISEPVPSLRADSVPGVQDLARLLYFSAGITRQRAYPSGEIYFRAAACTGALYEIELYVVSSDLAGLDAGVSRLLDLDTRGEVSLCLVPIGRTSESSLPAPREAPALGLETIPLSQREVEYPAMLEMHGASSLRSLEEVTQWRGKPPVLPSSPLAEAIHL